MSKPGRPRKERYCRLMGGFWRNAKVRRLSLEACGLLAKAWSYSADQMTDGRIPLEMLQAWAGKRFEKLMGELAPFLTIEDIDAVSHDWSEVNITAAEWEAKLESDRNRKRFPPGNGAESPPETPRSSERARVNIQTAAQTRTRTKTKSSSSDEEEQTDSAAGEPPRRSVPELEARYPAELVTEARTACALARKNGRMADGVWVTTLERLEALPVDAVVRAMRVFVEKHADGDKKEEYLIGIARREARPSDRREPSRIDPAEAAASQRAALDLFGAVEKREVANG